MRDLNSYELELLDEVKHEFMQAYKIGVNCANCLFCKIQDDSWRCFEGEQTCTCLIKPSKENCIGELKDVVKEACGANCKFFVHNTHLQFVIKRVEETTKRLEFKQEFKVDLYYNEETRSYEYHNEDLDINFRCKNLYEGIIAFRCALLNVYSFAFIYDSSLYRDEYKEKADKIKTKIKEIIDIYDGHIKLTVNSGCYIVPSVEF